MQIAQTFASKAAVAVVATAMVFSFAAPAAKAATAEELQAQIATLMAQISALQGGTTSTPTTGAAMTYTWTRDLRTGSTGADVMALQKFLNSDADTRVAATGAGSMGMETQTFGPATAAAVSKFQVKYRADILTPAGLTNPTGTFGPSSRAKANALSAVVTTPTTPATSTTPTTPSTDLSGEATFDDFSADDADDSSISEGASDAEAAVFTFSFTDGDASISRLDVKFDPSNSSARQYDALDTVALYVDGKKVAEKDASSKSDYLKPETDGVIRFSGLDIVAKEDEDLDVTVMVTLKDGLDTEELTSNWEVSVDAMRFFDASGVASDEDVAANYSSEVATFTVDEQGTNDNADVKKNTSTPDDGVVKVDDKTTKTSEKVFLFNIDVDQDSSDLVLGDAVVGVKLDNQASTTITANSVISAAYLTIDGTKIKGTAGSNAGTNILVGNNATVDYTFDFKDMDLAADDVYTAELTLEFKGQNDGANYNDGVIVTASVDGGDWDLEGETGDNVLSGVQTGNDLTLANIVPVVTGVDSSISQANNVSNSGSIIFTFKVEAQDGDVDVKSAVLNAAASLTSSAASALAKPTPVLSKTSGDATAISGGYTVSEGDSATFTLTYSFTTGSSTNNGNYTVNLMNVTGVKVDETSPALPLAN